MCVSLSAVVTLVLLFGPKLYIIIFKPEKNNRSAFTTSADLRIHIVGGTVCYYILSIVSIEFPIRMVHLKSSEFILDEIQSEPIERVQQFQQSRSPFGSS